MLQHVVAMTTSVTSQCACAHSEPCSYVIVLPHAMCPIAYHSIFFHQGYHYWQRQTGVFRVTHRRAKRQRSTGQTALHRIIKKIFFMLNLIDFKIENVPLGGMLDISLHRVLVSFYKTEKTWQRTEDGLSNLNIKVIIGLPLIYKANM